MKKIKIIEVPEARVKITIEWCEEDEQLEFPLSPISLEMLSQRVGNKLLSDPDVDLSAYNKHQYISNARHIFCYCARIRHGFSYSEIQQYLKRKSVDSVKHSVKRVTNCNQKTDGALWSAYKRYEQ